MSLLRAEDLSKTYQRREVVRGVGFEVAAGEIVGLLGPNGAGKTTSFNMVAGLVPPDRGQVWLGGTDLARLPLYKRAQAGLGYLPQESTVFRGLSVADNFLAVLEALRVPKQERRQRVEGLLHDFNLLHVRRSLGQYLSGGERRRVEMARALIPNPQVMLLDEPFAGVDPIAVAEIRRFIREMRDRNIGVLVTDHNVRETLRICDRAYLIAEGKILLAGSPQEIVDNPVARATYLGQDFTLH